MTNWTQLIPARIRTTLYIGFGVLSLTQTAVLAYTAAVGQTAPLWAIGGGAVLGVIGGAFGFVAAGNTNVVEDAVTMELDASLLTERINEVVAQYESAGRHEVGYPVSDEHGPTEAGPERYNA